MSGKVPHVKGGGYVGGPEKQPSLKSRQKADIEKTFNQPDPVGDFIRRVIGGNKEKKKTGF